MISGFVMCFLDAVKIIKGRIEIISDGLSWVGIKFLEGSVRCSSILLM